MFKRSFFRSLLGIAAFAAAALTLAPMAQASPTGYDVSVRNDMPAGSPNLRVVQGVTVTLIAPGDTAQFPLVGGSPQYQLYINAQTSTQTVAFQASVLWKSLSYLSNVRYDDPIQGLTGIDMTKGQWVTLPVGGTGAGVPARIYTPDPSCHDGIC